MQCSLPKNVNECPFYNAADNTCNNSNKCSFQEKEETPAYVRETRWYEKYYK